MIETVPWRLRFHPSISRYSALELDSIERNFRSSETVPIKVDSRQVAIVITAAAWRFTGRSFVLIESIKMFLFVVADYDAIAEKVSKLSLNSRKRLGARNELNLCS